MVARFFTILAVVGVLGVGVSADTSTAQLAVGVVVVRSCAIDAQPSENSSPTLRFRCTTGANSNLRLSESIQSPAETVSSDGLQIITINF